jgi:hypothetical protein
LSTTNPTWTGPGSNPGLRSERPATNRLSHGRANGNLLELLIVILEELMSVDFTR